MSEADDLARRFVALWTEYLTTLLADPNLAEPLGRWLAVARELLPADAAAGVASRPPADAAAAAGAPGEHGPALAELARRVDELADRLAALERAAKRDRAPPDDARRGDRAGRR